MPVLNYRLPVLVPTASGKRRLTRISGAAAYFGRSTHPDLLGGSERSRGRRRTPNALNGLRSQARPPVITCSARPLCPTPELITAATGFGQPRGSLFPTNEVRPRRTQDFHPRSA